MARLTGPLFGDEASGGIAGVLYYKHNVNCGIVSKKKIRVLTKSSNQHTERQRFKNACIAWRALSDSEKRAWSSSAVRPFCGYNVFVRYFILTNLNCLDNLSWALNSWDWNAWQIPLI
jgi:hypothetical protein